MIEPTSLKNIRDPHSSGPRLKRCELWTLLWTPGKVQFLGSSTRLGFSLPWCNRQMAPVCLFPSRSFHFSKPHASVCIALGRTSSPSNDYPAPPHPMALTMLQKPTPSHGTRACSARRAGDLECQAPGNSLLPPPLLYQAAKGFRKPAGHQ